MWCHPKTVTPGAGRLLRPRPSDATVVSKGGVEDTRLEAKAKDTQKKKIRGPKAKDRNARGQGQGPRTQAQAFSKKKNSSKIFFRRSPIHWYTQDFDWGDLNYKSHEMTSSKFFQRGSFCGTKISQNGRSEIVACLHVTRIL